MLDACVTFDDLTLGYDSHPAVHHLNGVLVQGSLTAVVGANGCGKSTLMKSVAGVLRPLSGRCVIAPGIRRAYLPQISELDRSFPAHVIDLVSLGLWPCRGLLGRHGRADRETLLAALAAVGLDGFEKRSIDSLSGGQLQRALFARVLVQDANLILLDEPFNAVDSKTIMALLGLIERWHGEGRTIMVVVHDLDLVRRYFPETLLLARRPIAWGDTCTVMTPDNLRQAWRFHEAWDECAPWCAPGGQDGCNGQPEHDDHHGYGSSAVIGVVHQRVA